MENQWVNDRFHSIQQTVKKIAMLSVLCVCVCVGSTEIHSQDLVYGRPVLYHRATSRALILSLMPQFLESSYSPTPTQTPTYVFTLIKKEENKTKCETTNPLPPAQALLGLMALGVAALEWGDGWTVKCLPLNREGWSPHPQNPCKCCVGMVACL